jgi:hypothetical protein
MQNRFYLKAYFIITFLSFFSNHLLATDTLYFVGNIKISSKVSYTYNLRFIVEAENKIRGYSLSDLGGPNEVKTKIIGTFDSSKMTLTYEEKDVLRSKVDLKKNDLCFVKATLKFKKSKVLETLSGKFTAYEPGKTDLCASGEVKLVNTNRIKVLLKKIYGADESLKNTGPESKTKPIEISDDKGKELLITGTKVKLTIWDQGKVDGDKISIMLDGKYVLENYSITAQTKIIELLLSDKEISTLKIIALNEGTLPPNTAAIKIETEAEEYPILTQANVNEERTIYLKKKK